MPLAISQLERCPSGPRSTIGNRVFAERRNAGSNPALSVPHRRRGSLWRMANGKRNELTEDEAAKGGMADGLRRMADGHSRKGEVCIIMVRRFF